MSIQTKPQKRTVTPFRYDIVGSFLRPQALKEARLKFKNGEITAEQLKEVENDEIVKLVQKQKEVGLQAVTDGEFRRSWWHLDFFWGLDGVERTIIDQGYQFNGAESRPETARLTGKISYSSHPFVSHYEFLKDAAGEDVVARQSIPAAAQFLFELDRAENKESTNELYPNREELISDIAKAYKASILAFYAAGCRSIQIDDCTWGALCDEQFIAFMNQIGVNVAEYASELAKLNEEVVTGLPEDLVVTTHVCRGNYVSTYAGVGGGYEPIAQTLLNINNYSGYYLEFDTERAGDFKPLRFLKDNQQVVLGLFSSKFGELESKEDILKRIEEAKQYVDLNRICLSPQCGFASTEEGNHLTEEQQWRKLAYIKEIAEEIWN
ncbi:5-methyltetrahydropteroyltriglutamate--homocysteine S-methyltransferase [Paenibacillus sp. FSL R5-0887]|jgi:5-methyltetrahydropteroyltriglutamate--homocysteine methyltransferase|uniref:5-methyltetrahydropteroyltriglutamate-- homocysteine S-methyltransferase n=1 Tax=Paenibacillus TaxID=44249 RepID=UPI00096CD73E|nr:5-methyltetrahydropteroyltriglutamate--homocysteine S-methyltransferase [Paenibacillus odorifer]OMD01207.1 5-methyltetrahydropteroyltriglutamate--homocysteine methyltransferase [Paenibacillus odorifer]OMD70967.1 5-methyltetrahydropteroyltriglutamate--homocysteine methyltransferase [Paenibacillus odorifer]OMD75731.1 5-methyltetrahydropteroyltriglutamate--homocysteine methyltransferase [Paenibacillus odorifer]OMD90009.1 5-methyltetrahydropteroyltriglutamate--homocysteine methyltransferase [Pae